MFYMLKVYVLVAAVVFTGSAVMLLLLFGLHEARAYAAAQRRIVERVTSLTRQPRYFTNPIAISRTISRIETTAGLSSRSFQ
jgi:hypothetical protein